MAAGKVITGYSLPYVALYANSSGTVSYSSGQKLARGVSVDIEAEAADDNKFSADNRIVEDAGGIFQRGTLTAVVDGLKNAAEKLIMGLPTPTDLTVGTSTVKVYAYGDAAAPPYVGFACVVRFMEDGVTTYAPFLLTKCKFNIPNTSAETGNPDEQINWQTQELTATILRDDTSAHNWKKLAEDQDTEEEAEAVIKTWLNITSTQGGSV